MEGDVNEADLPNTPTVDVIIPAYNISRHLPAALESVISQTFENWRIFLVDDGSTDNTDEVIAPFKQRLGSRLTYLKRENGGIAAARNTGIRNSAGQYIAILDGDDVWLPNRLAMSIACLEDRPEAGLSYGLITRIADDGSRLETFQGNSPLAEGKLASQIYMRTVELPCPTITFRRSCIEEVGLFDESMRAVEDRDLWLRIALRSEIAFIPEVIALYRMSANSVSRNYDKQLQAQLRFIDKHYGAAGCGPVQRRYARARAFKQRAEAFKASRQPWKALSAALRAVTTNPAERGNFRTAASLTWNLLRFDRQQG